MSYLVLCAFRNRKSLTLRFVDQVRTAASNTDTKVDFLLFDDGSSDHTSDALLDLHPDLTILRGDGTAFWNGAMTVLLREAMQRDDVTAYILANDDVSLRQNGFAAAIQLFERLNETRPTAVVGAFENPDGGLSYSGFRRANALRPLALSPVPPTGQPADCDTFNGNFVIVPARSCKMVGGLDPAFLHAYGDVDLGYRLAEAGVRLVVTPTYVGTCQRGLPLSVQLARLPLGRRWKLMFGPLRSPRDYSHFVQKYVGPLAPLYIAKDIFRRVLLVATAR